MTLNIMVLKGNYCNGYSHGEIKVDESTIKHSSFPRTTLVPRKIMTPGLSCFYYLLVRLGRGC